MSIAGLVIFTWATFVVALADNKCSFENCPSYKAGMLNVHLVCHTHDDSGWLKTVDQYYYGSQQDITKDGVQYILDTLFPPLLNDPNKRFSYCESNFFWRWWKNQNNETQQMVIELVNRGQLEFIGGGWVQHDEATTHYAAMIDQMTTGHQFLNDTFGRCALPKIGWQIDPFGHSRESASLMAQMGFDALFFARIHYIDRQKRWLEKSMEMKWHGSDDLGSDGDIFTGVFWQHYGPPNGFCFDDGCDDQPIMDDPDLEEYNVNEKVTTFISEVKEQSLFYATNHIMLTMGSDFQYKNAYQWFKNLDKLIKYVNQVSDKSKVNVFYSTPSCYAQALQSTGYDFPEKSDDFFPYANDVHSYWTGYFTSRPALKGFVRSTNNLLQTCQRLNAVAQLGSSDLSSVNDLHQPFGIAQHHDAVSGTAKQAVTNDYQKMLYKGIVSCQDVANDAMQVLAPKNGADIVQNTFCTLLNETMCNVTQSSDNFLVTVHNGLARQLSTYARLPVPTQTYAVFDPNGNEILPEVVATFQTTQIANTASYQLVFPVQIAPFGFSTYYVTKTDSMRPKPKKAKRSIKQKVLDDCPQCSLSNNLVTVTFNKKTGLVQSITDISSGITSSVTQNFFWYKGMSNAIPGNQPSGAYIFRPDGQTPTPVTTQIVKTQKIGDTGDFVQEMRQTFSDWVTQTVRLYQGKPFVEFEWTVGPIPCSDGISREVISRFDTDVQNDGTFFTDANGRQMMTRQLNYQPTYNYSDDEPTAGNYYPINTRISIKDTSKQITVLNDRSQGGASLADGSMELMVHRRDLQDDGFGVNEALNETGVDGRGLVVTGKHWFLLSTPANGARRHRTYAQEMFYQPMYTFAPSDNSYESYMNNYRTSYSGLNKALPVNVNFLTLAQWKESSDVLLRFEHLFQKGEDPQYSQPVTIDLKNMFPTFDIVSMEETTLTTLYKATDDTGSKKLKHASATNSTTSITLQPMEIRTFIAQVMSKLKTEN